jgi:hypothetical protein
MYFSHLRLWRSGLDVCNGGDLKLPCHLEAERHMRRRKSIRFINGRPSEHVIAQGGKARGNRTLKADHRPGQLRTGQILRGWPPHA